MEENKNTNNQKKDVKKIVKTILIVVNIILFVWLVKELWVLFDAYNSTKNQVDNLTVNYSLDNINLDSTEVAAQLKRDEQEEMKKNGISEEYLTEVVIKNGDIYNYAKLDDFYNKFCVIPGSYQSEANETLKVISYKDDSNIDEVSIHYEIWPKGEVLYDGKLVITANGETFEGEYFHPIFRKPVKDDEGELFINYYYVVDGNQRDLFKYRLSSTSYLGTIEFRFSENEEEKLVKYPVQDAEGKAKTISVVGGVVTVLERGATEPVFLQEAIESGVLTYDRILKIAEADSCYGKCQKDMFKDGGSVVYEYADFVIYEVNSIESAHGIVFATKSMTLDQAKNWVDPAITID